MNLNNAHEGYDYQDLLTSYFILKEILLGNQDSIFSIDKKNTASNIPDSFDDLVIVNNTNIQRKQIKYSNDDIAKKLEKTDLANNSGYKLALFELYRTWSELNTPNSEFRLCLAWDEPIDDNIKRVLESYSVESSFDNFSTKLYRINLDNLWEESPEKFNRWNKLKNYVQENNIDRNDFKLFCDSLVIELELPKASLKLDAPSDLENILLQQAEKLGVGQYPNDDIYISDFLERLAKQVGYYRTRSAKLTGINILQDLRVKTDFGKIEQKFKIDQSKNIKSNEKYSLFITKIIENKKTLLVGEPGSGKSWFLTNFIEYLEADSKKVIRHYCFTDTEDEFIEKRVSSDVLFGNLVADILKVFPQLKEIKDNLFVSSLDELNLLLSYVHEELIIIIDGLDHINRVLKNSSTLAEDKTKIIEYIAQIIVPDDISIILGSQPVSEIQILIDDFEYIDYRLSKWTIDDTLELMNKYSVDDRKLEDKLLSEYLYKKSEGNPLYLTYIIKTLMTLQKITVELINNLPQYDFNLKNYYEYLASQMEDNLTSEILSCLEFSITVKELEKISPQSHHIQNDLKTLSPILNENSSIGGIKLYHDSFRRYNIEKLEENNGLQNIYKLLTKWLNKQGFYKNDKAYRHLLSYYIKLGKYKKVTKHATNDFLTKSLYHGYSEKIIKKNYDNFLNVANMSQDWELFVYISELNRTMQSRLSDNYNEFEERFELYFEAIGVIYGFERANSILYFDEKQNFSDELIAKAFYISQKNSYTPNWQKIEHYFKDDISIEKFKYFVAYLIGTNKVDENVNKNRYRLILPKNLKYLKILVEEIYYLDSFNKILFLYEKCPDKYKYKIVKKINNILDNTTCNQRILVKYQIQHLCLPPLNLDFIDDYIKEGVLDNFYYLVRQYSKNNLSALEQFEETIPSHNFFYNWLKFFIRNFIIEEKIIKNEFHTYKEVENAFIKNFEFLTSDVNPYKGKPRVIDFTYKNGHIIDKSIEQGLKYIQSKKSWFKVIDYLNLIHYNTIAIVEKNINNKNIQFIIKAYKNFDKSEDEYYSSYLEYKLKKSIYYIKIKKQKKAKKNLLQAMRLVTSYTSRKDTTLDEIQSPLIAINKLNKNFAFKYAKKLLPLNLSVQNHSEDGKGIRWLYISWFEKFLKINRREATNFLINQFLKDNWFWKYEYMFVEYIQSNEDINPLILNFLYKLSSTNEKDSYISSFLDNTHKLIITDRQLAKQSLISILERDLNNDSEKLSDKTIKKLQVLKNILNVSIPITKLKKEKETYSIFNEQTLQEKIDEIFLINKPLSGKSFEELSNYFKKRDRQLDDKDIVFLIYYINEKNDDEITKKLLLPIIQRKLVFTENYYELLRLLIKALVCPNELKTLLLINIFVCSQGGWFENFVNIESLKDAVKVNKKKSLKYLARSLQRKFYKIYSYPQSTANLVIAFEYAGLKKKDILPMYQKGFEVIEYRLPNRIDFDWENIKDTIIKSMSNDEIAIVMILVRLRNLDTSIQKEIIFALNYILNYDENLLIKPMKWFFEHIDDFPHLSIASLFELFLLHVDDKQKFFQELKDDIVKGKNLENLYIQNSLDSLIDRIQNV